MTDTDFRKSRELSPAAGHSLSRLARQAAASPLYTALVYLVAVSLAEAIVSLTEPRVGMVLHGAILIALLVHATLHANGHFTKFLLALALAPLIRLVSLTLPLPDYPFVYWYFAVGAPLFIATFLIIRQANLDRKMLALKAGNLPVQLLIGLSGLGLGYVEYLILRPAPLAEELTLRFIWLPALILLVFTGILEEVIFRGVMQYTALRSLGRFGLWYVAILFAVLHMGYRSLLDVIFVFVVAMFFGIVTLRTGSLLGVSISHGLTNITLFLVFPFLLATPTQQLIAPQDILGPQPGTTLVAPIPTRTPTQTVTVVLDPTKTPFQPATGTMTPTITGIATETAPATQTREPTETSSPTTEATDTLPLPTWQPPASLTPAPATPTETWTAVSPSATWTAAAPTSTPSPSPTSPPASSTPAEPTPSETAEPTLPPPTVPVPPTLAPTPTNSLPEPSSTPE
jgi:uncharacterized protein